MPRIVALRANGQSQDDVVSLVLSQDAVTAGPDGEPWCGVTLNVEQARCLAQRLCHLATEIENQEEGGHRTSLLFEQASSVVVLHDGSEQSHRAFRAAMLCASRSFGTLNLIGIFGITTPGTATGTGSTAGDDEWQKAWLDRLAEAYSEQAEASGVMLNARFLPADDPCVILDLLYRMEFNLLVIPKSLTQFGIHGERLMPSIISRRNVNILVCP